MDDFHSKIDQDSPKQMTPAVQKTLAIMFFFLLLLFIKYKPYEYAQTIPDTWMGQFFSLFVFISNQTLGIVHEGGHGICYILPCPEFFMVLNGTLFQVLFPALIGYYYKRRGQIFPYLIGIFFVGFSLHYTAWYISTAHQGLYLDASESFLGVDAYHDFNYILSRLHLLDYDGIIAGFTRFIAYGLMIYATFKMLFFAFFMTNTTNRKAKI
jgi:hypothetical protein